MFCNISLPGLHSPLQRMAPPFTCSCPISGRNPWLLPFHICLSVLSLVCPIHPLLSLLFATVLVLVIVLSFNYCDSFPFSSLHSVALEIFLKCKTGVLFLCFKPIQWLLIALRVKCKLPNKGLKSFVIWLMLRFPSVSF